MKKFMLLFAVLLYGCATQNPGEQVAQQVAGAVVGATVGYNGAKAAGANQPWSVVGGIVGAGTGTAVVRGTQCEARGDCNSTYQSSGGNGMFLMDRGFGPYRNEFNAPYSGRDERGCYPDGMLVPYGCTRLETGGYICSGPRNNNPCTQGGVASAQPQQSAVVSRSIGNSFGLTVDNYRSSPEVYPTCRTGNYGHDAYCLRVQADELDSKQTACVEGHGPCKSNYGAIAGAYRELASRLSQTQAQLEGH